MSRFQSKKYGVLNFSVSKLQITALITHTIDIFLDISLILCVFYVISRKYKKKYLLCYV